MTRTVFINFEGEFPDVAETRFLKIIKHSRLPPDIYKLRETYCADPECDCGLVRFDVENSDGESIGEITWVFGNDPPPGKSNPYIEPPERKYRWAEDALGLVEKALKDSEYKERLKRHYRMIKELVAKPGHHAAEAVRRDRAMMNQFVEDILTRGSGAAQKKGWRSPSEKKMERKRRQKVRAKARRRKKKK